MEAEIHFDKCKIYHCPKQATSLCRDHGLSLCTCCTIAFHHDCRFEAKNEEDFIERGIAVLNTLIDEIKTCNECYKIEEIYCGFKEDFEVIFKAVKEFNSKHKDKQISIIESDSAIKELKILIKLVYHSQSYTQFKDFTLNLELSSHTSKNLEDSLAVLKARKIKTGFEMDIKSEENNFKENTLKTILKEVIVSKDKLKKLEARNNKKIKRNIEELKEDLKKELIRELKRELKRELEEKLRIEFRKENQEQLKEQRKELRKELKDEILKELKEEFKVEMENDQAFKDKTNKIDSKSLK